DAVLVHKKAPSARALIRYAKEESHPVFLDREAVTNSGRRIVSANVMSEDETGCVRHDHERLAQVLFRWYSGTPKGMRKLYKLFGKESVIS
ncbi:MAG: hypothetical protein MJK14_20270, partial [Rivularia sp. ALOHA_DT_140]|nr:hypothetical protein [Rivularia sp. ALOHA_DT_140]